MPKPKDATNKNEDGGIKIDTAESSIAQFTRRPVPTTEEVQAFEETIEDEVKEEEIDESLNEIYQDDKGGMVDVRKMDVKKRHGILFWFFAFLVIFGSLGGAGYAAYQYFYIQPGSDATAVEFYIEADNETVAGEEFFLEIHYKNLSNIPIRNAMLEVNYPENFIVLDSFPEALNNKINSWELDFIPAKTNGKVKIKGMMIGEEDDAGIVLADLTYSPQNFSSEFRKEAPFTIVITDIGIDFDFDYVGSALVGEENEILLKFRNKEKGFLNNFRLSIEPQENLEFLSVADNEENEETADFNVVRPGVWQVNEVLSDERVLPISIKFNEKVKDAQDLVLIFEYAHISQAATATEEMVYYKFLEEKLNFEVMKSDLNLTLIINGSREDQGVDFGEILNYSIVYKNRGETDMTDVVIMAVFESEFLDPETLIDPNNGRIKNNTISWGKVEVEDLALLKQNDEGIIDFSINVVEIGEIDTSKNYQITSYAQFTIGNKEEVKETVDNRSNTILNRINSDLKLSEQVRYFSPENIPVGAGPHPPRVGETTSYKVYWELSNNLHELSNLKIKTVLPGYVAFNKKTQASVGEITYNGSTREVVWDIGRLPVTVYKASAEFSISITPIAEDKNTIMVLLSGSEVSAVDSITDEKLELKSIAKTSKLEDDEIATGDGIVD